MFEYMLFTKEEILSTIDLLHNFNYHTCADNENVVATYMPHMP